MKEYIQKGEIGELAIIRICHMTPGPVSYTHLDVYKRQKYTVVQIMKQKEVKNPISRHCLKTTRLQR